MLTVETESLGIFWPEEEFSPFLKRGKSLWCPCACFWPKLILKPLEELDYDCWDFIQLLTLHVSSLYMNVQSDVESG